MHELITRLTNKAGISTEQAAQVIETIKEFAKEKFPMMSGTLDSLLSDSPATNFPEAPVDPTVPAHGNAAILDKISDYIPGETGQKVEDFAKQAADKAEDLYDAAKDKLSGLFGGEKK